MRTLTFILDTQTGTDEMAPATLTIAEQADGSLSVTITNIGDGDGMIGDIRGLFFDVADDNLLGNLVFDGADITETNQSGSVSNLGGGVTTSGVPDSPYEIGIEFGTPGISTDDYQVTSFTLSADRALTLDDIALESFTVRQTSVGAEGGDRGGSDKLYGIAPYPVDAVDDFTALMEDEVAIGNLFANDIDEDAGDADANGIPDGLTITEIDGDAGSVGSAIEVADGIIVTVNADGSYTVDATDADWLAEGEVFSGSLVYSVDDGNGGSDSATFSYTVTGLADEEPPVEDQDHFGTFLNKKGNAEHDISNIVLYLKDEDGDILKVKIDGWSGVTDLDDVDLNAFLTDNNFLDYDLLAVSIKAGNNHNRDLGPGEGQLFLLDGDEDIDYVAGGAVPDGLTLADLAAKADMTFGYSPELFI